jgi:hypothetical protein
MADNNMRGIGVVAIGIVAIVAGLLWWTLHGRGATSSGTSGARVVTTFDPANEGSLVSVTGTPTFAAGAVDDELGITTQAGVLWRHVEMAQWQERCVANGCAQSIAWSSSLIDASTFNEKTGRVNPGAFPFSSRAFAAPALRIGAFTVDPAVLATQATQPRVVSAAELPPNLAAIFRDHDGGLHSGEDIEVPAVGDLRVSYRVLATGPLTVTGVQRGQGLVAVEPQD